MDEAAKEYKARLSAEVSAFRQALTSESDRGCALFATAFLDKALSDLLYVSLVYDRKKIEVDLFDQGAPLSTFSARIKLAFYLGKISRAARRDLDLMRAIRNEFAHHPAVVSFADQAVANRCRELRFSFREKKDDPRAQFLGSVFGVLAHINAATLTVQAPDEKPDDAPSEEAKAKHRAKVAKLSQPNKENVEGDG